MQVAPSTGNSMVLKDDRQRVRDLLRETVTMLCKRGLSYNAQLSVEGLLGITLDDDEVFLVNIKETVQNPTSPSPLTVTQQDLMDSLSSSGEHSPTGSDSRADIVSRAVTPMHTFRGSGVRGKQRSRKRVWGQETRVSQQGDIRRMETQSSNESSSSMMGPPRKQQITKAVLPVVEDGISLQHSGIKQEPIDITADPCKEHCESQQSQNFDNSFASNVLDVDQPIEVSQNGADNVDRSAVCRLPLAVAVEGSQSDDRSLVEAIPGCSSWSETADKSPGAKSHVTAKHGEPGIEWTESFSKSTSEESSHNAKQGPDMHVIRGLNDTFEVKQEYGMDGEGHRPFWQTVSLKTGLVDSFRSQRGTPNVIPTELCNPQHSDAPPDDPERMGFLCRVCSKTLSSQQSLMMHERRHKGIYPVHCPVCRKGFASRYNLRGHMVAHTNFREYKCHLCSGEYVYKPALRKHYRDVHNLDIPPSELIKRKQ